MLAVGLIGLGVIIGFPLAQGQPLGITLWGYIAFAIAGTGLVLLIVAGAMAKAARRNESRSRPAAVDNSEQ